MSALRTSKTVSWPYTVLAVKGAMSSARSIKSLTLSSEIKVPQDTVLECGGIQDSF
jgi:hypothetical protein